MQATTRWTVTAIVLAAFAIAMVLTLGDMRLASSQTVTLVAKQADAEVPLDDPFAGVWKGASPIEAPLSGQLVIQPKGGGDRTVTARSLHDNDRLYVLLEWPDDTEDLLVSRQTEFTDAAAVQFPVSEGESVPSFCMGDPTAPVNVWQWKGAWQNDIDEGYVDVEDVYPNMAVDTYPFEEEDVFYPASSVGNIFAETDRTTPVDNLLAGSFGTLTQADDQMVDGSGEWRNGSWRVLFARDLDSGDGYSRFSVNESTNVAFAVWDGAENERNGVKSVSQFLTLTLSDEIADSGGGIEVWQIALIAIGVAALTGVLAFRGWRRSKQQ
jgi:hypothetical protein